MNSRGRGGVLTVACGQSGHMKAGTAELSRAEWAVLASKAGRIAQARGATERGRSLEKKMRTKKAFTNSRSHTSPSPCRVILCRGAMFKLRKFVRGCSGMRAWLPAANKKNLLRPSAYPRGSVTSRSDPRITWLSRERYSRTLPTRHSKDGEGNFLSGITASGPHVYFQRSEDRKAERSRRSFSVSVPNESAQPTQAGGPDARPSLYATPRLELTDPEHALKPDPCAYVSDGMHFSRLALGGGRRAAGWHKKGKRPPYENRRVGGGLGPMSGAPVAGEAAWRRGDERAQYGVGALGPCELIVGRLGRNDVPKMGENFLHNGGHGQRKWWKKHPLQVGPGAELGGGASDAKKSARRAGCCKERQLGNVGFHTGAESQRQHQDGAAAPTATVHSTKNSWGAHQTPRRHDQAWGCIRAVCGGDCGAAHAGDWRMVSQKDSSLAEQDEYKTCTRLTCGDIHDSRRTGGGRGRGSKGGEDLAGGVHAGRAVSPERETTAEGSSEVTCCSGGSGRLSGVFARHFGKLSRKRGEPFDEVGWHSKGTPHLRAHEGAGEDRRGAPDPTASARVPTHRGAAEGAAREGKIVGLGEDAEGTASRRELLLRDKSRQQGRQEGGWGHADACDHRKVLPLRGAPYFHQPIQRSLVEWARPGPIRPRTMRRICGRPEPRGDPLRADRDEGGRADGVAGEAGHRAEHGLRRHQGGDGPDLRHPGGKRQAAHEGGGGDLCRLRWERHQLLLLPDGEMVGHSHTRHHQVEGGERPDGSGGSGSHRREDGSEAGNLCEGGGRAAREQGEEGGVGAGHAKLPPLQQRGQRQGRRSQHRGDLPVGDVAGGKGIHDRDLRELCGSHRKACRQLPEDPDDNRAAGGIPGGGDRDIIGEARARGASSIKDLHRAQEEGEVLCRTRMRRSRRREASLQPWAEERCVRWEARWASARNRVAERSRGSARRAGSRRRRWWCGSPRRRRKVLLRQEGRGRRKRRRSSGWYGQEPSGRRGLRWTA